MSSKINFSNPPIPCKFHTKKPNLVKRNTIIFSSFSSSEKQQKTISTTVETPSNDNKAYTINFKTKSACKLGISRYPDFEYDAEGGIGNGLGAKATQNQDNNDILVSFDLQTLYIPSLTSSTTKFLGLSLPPFLRIDIVPEAFQGTIDQESGKVDLEFKAKFLFSAGSIYKAPPLIVKTVLTSEESKGRMKSGRGMRLDEEGKCRLVGVATVEPIDDFIMNSFLGLPTECLAELNAVIFISSTS